MPGFLPHGSVKGYRDVKVIMAYFDSSPRLIFQLESIKRVLCHQRSILVNQIYVLNLEMFLDKVIFFSKCDLTSVHFFFFFFQIGHILVKLLIHLLMEKINKK